SSAARVAAEIMPRSATTQTRPIPKPELWMAPLPESARFRDSTLIGTATLITYATVVLGLFLIPGPAVLLTLARATTGGRRVGLAASGSPLAILFTPSWQVSAFGNGRAVTGAYVGPSVIVVRAHTYGGMLHFVVRQSDACVPAWMTEPLRWRAIDRTRCAVA